jgi:YVTN family beta-propeller protein
MTILARPKAKQYLIKSFAILSIISLGFWVNDRPTTSKVSADTQTPSKVYSFESPQVHPLSITPDGTRLLAVNSPDHRLSVFDITGDSPRLLNEIPVGLEPVSVAARNNNEAWVVNWLSDSVSVVNLLTGNVVRTINVGDEPTDIIFAGGAKDRAFVCLSGTRQVKVFEGNSDQPIQIVDLAGKQPRSLSKDAKGENVYASVFESGNQTTIISAEFVQESGGLPSPTPAMSPTLPAFPQTGIIVKNKSKKKWVDETGDTKWSKFVPFTLADNDLFVIDAIADKPVVKSSVAAIGTHIGNSVFDAVSGRLFVVNTDSENVVRFEPKVSGRFIKTQLGVVSFSNKKTSVNTVSLNPHIDYSKPESSEEDKAKSLSMPTDIVQDSLGRFYIASTGSAKVGILDNNGMIQGRVKVGEGPTGLAMDNQRRQLYVLNRFDQTISVINTESQQELGRVAIGYNPEPEFVREGRQFLYGTEFSSHGDISCASCHRNGHTDGLAWDLGDPTGKLDVVKTRSFLGNGNFTFNLHPMKGPMTTQSLRGIVGTEPLHWRGDKERLKNFDGAFTSLLGGKRKPTEAEMAKFESFIKTLTFPPNPLQNLDRTYPNPSSGASAARGERIFIQDRTDRGALTCNFCHVTFPSGTGTNGLIIPGQVLLMANGRPEPQPMKIPQLRGMYQKTGYLRQPGKQLSGYGFAHDGVFDTLFNFLKTINFTFNNDQERRDVEAYVLALDTGIAPSVGLQVTVNETNKASNSTLQTISLLMSQADKRNSELVVKGIFRGQQRGFFYVGNGMFQTDKSGEAAISLQSLIQAVSKGNELTFTGAPVENGRRIAIDHNDNGKLDGDE